LFPQVVVLIFRFAVSALVLVPVFKPRTILQLIIGMIFVFVYLLLVLRADPMLHRENNSFNSFVVLQLLFTVSTEGCRSSRFVLTSRFVRVRSQIWAGLFIRLQNGTQNSSFVFGYDELFVTIVLFLVRERRLRFIDCVFLFPRLNRADQHQRDRRRACFPDERSSDRPEAGRVSVRRDRQGRSSQEVASRAVPLFLEPLAQAWCRSSRVN